MAGTNFGSEWDDVTAPSTNTIVLTVTDDQMQQHQATYTFEVLPNNQIDQLTTAATWKRQRCQEPIAYGGKQKVSGKAPG